MGKRREVAVEAEAALFSKSQTFFSIKDAFTFYRTDNLARSVLPEGCYLSSGMIFRSTTD
jgi:hypothetical protein